MSYIPSLQANYTAVPNTFLQLALDGKLGREALVVLLYLFSKTYGWSQEKGFVSLEDLVHGASLTEAEALQGAREAISNNLVLEMPLDPGSPEAQAMYVLNTVENRRFMDAYVTASSQEIPVPDMVLAASPPSAGARAPAAPGPAPSPAPRPQPVMAAAPTPDFSGSMEAPEDMEPVFEDAPPPATIPVIGEPPPLAPIAAAPEPAQDEPYEDWGYTFKTVEMIIRLLGRVPTKDEKNRLQELGATDVELIEAMGQLIEKKVDIYSSDLVVYEYEAMKSSKRRLARESAMKNQQEERQARQKDCRSCDGLGYVFIGVSGIQECEACKA